MAINKIKETRRQENLKAGVFNNNYVRMQDLDVVIDEANAEIATNTTIISTLSGNLKEITVVLSSAEILNLFTTPVELIPAQGAGTIIEVVGGFVALDYGTAAYVSGGAVSIRDAGTTQSFMDINASVVQDTADVIQTLASFAPKVTENTAVEVTNDTGAFTTGDGELKIKLIYRVHATGL